MLYNVHTVNNNTESANKMSYKVLNEDGLYVVIDELKNVLQVFEKRSEATAMIRELNTAVKSNVRKVEGTYGTGVERVETAVEEAVIEQIEAATEVVETVVVETAVEEQVVEEVAKQQVITIVAVEQVDSNGKALKKSERVRLRIKVAKDSNETQEDVIKWTMDEIGFARSLAKVYVTNNWHKA